MEQWHSILEMSINLHEKPMKRMKPETNSINVYLYDRTIMLIDQIKSAGGIVRKLWYMTGDHGAWVSVPVSWLVEDRKNPPYDFEAGKVMHIPNGLRINVCPTRHEGCWKQALYWETTFD